VFANTTRSFSDLFQELLKRIPNLKVMILFAGLLYIEFVRVCYKSP